MGWRGRPKPVANEDATFGRGNHRPSAVQRYHRTPDIWRVACGLSGARVRIRVRGRLVGLGKNLTKIWLVSPLNSIYPRVYVEDGNGKAWGVSLFVP
jgi:hypothetical protein